jgi:hypothetical protein
MKTLGTINPTTSFRDIAAKLLSEDRHRVTDITNSKKGHAIA